MHPITENSVDIIVNGHLKATIDGGYREFVIIDRVNPQNLHQEVDPAMKYSDSL